MSGSINLKIITPSSVVVDEQVKEVVAPGELGEFGILAGHIPFISTLSPGLVKLKNDLETKSLIIHGGLAEICEDKVRILTEAAEYPDSIDRKEAQKELDLIQNQIKEHPKDLKQLEQLNYKLKLAQVRVANSSE